MKQYKNDTELFIDFFEWKDRQPSYLKSPAFYEWLKYLDIDHLDFEFHFVREKSDYNTAYAVAINKVLKRKEAQKQFRDLIE